MSFSGVQELTKDISCIYKSNKLTGGQVEDRSQFPVVPIFTTTPSFRENESAVKRYFIKQTEISEQL
jgi:hypothetical protein